MSRAAIIDLCIRFLPKTTSMDGFCHWNQIGFDHIAKDYGQGAGTTCGFLPHWLLWRLGCNDNSLVNRSSPGQGLKWKTGKNLLIFSEHAASYVKVDGALSAKMAAGAGGPMPGDFVIIRGGNWMNKETNQRDRDSAHIFVLLEVLKADGKEVAWMVAQTGVSNNQMQQGGQRTILTGKLKNEDMIEGANTIEKGPSLVFFANILGEEPNFPRRVTSYTNVDNISYGTEPNAAFTALFENRRVEYANNDWKAAIAPWLGWYEERNPGGFITMSPSYLLLERGHEITKFSKAGGMGAYIVETNGIWTRSGDRLDVEWRDHRRQSWTLARTFVPKEMTTGTPLTASAGTLARVKEKPAEIPAQWAATHFIGS